MFEGKDVNISPLMQIRGGLYVLTELIRLSKKMSKMKQVAQFLKKRKITLFPSSIPLISRVCPHLLLLYSLDIFRQVP